MDIELPLQALQSRVNTLEKVVQLIAGTLDDPVLRQINSDRGFRYEKPDIRHFCVLKAVRVVSALNASIVLAREGYAQEIGVLMRTLAEFATHIEFVLDRDDSEEHRSKSNNIPKRSSRTHGGTPKLRSKKRKYPKERCMPYWAKR